MKQNTDGFIASLIWGRIGVAVLCLIAFALSTFGIDFGMEDQATVNETVSGILAGVAGLLAIFSKIKEQIK
jgi:ABC-type nickel/cobalt efflux system permease component RcnA